MSSSLVNPCWSEPTRDETGATYRWRYDSNGKMEYDYDPPLSNQQVAAATPRTTGDQPEGRQRPSRSDSTPSWGSSGSTEELYTLSPSEVTQSQRWSTSLQTGENPNRAPLLSNMNSHSLISGASNQYISQRNNDHDLLARYGSNEHKAYGSGYSPPGNSGDGQQQETTPRLSYSYASPNLAQSYMQGAHMGNSKLTSIQSKHTTTQTSFQAGSTSGQSSTYLGQGHDTSPPGKSADFFHSTPSDVKAGELSRLSLGTDQDQQNWQFRTSDSQQTLAPSHGKTRAESKSQKKLDDKYKRIESKRLDRFYKVGRTFAMSWTEPAGDGAPPSKGSDSQFTRTHYGDTAYTEIRRFVVMAKNHGNVTCCPIHSYNGQGCLKPNLADKHEHTIIHTSSKAPKELYYNSQDRGRVYEGLVNDPIRVDADKDNPQADLGDYSRLNYSKLYTVEFSARVLNIGMVHKDSMAALWASNRVRQRDDSPDRPKKPSQTSGEKHRSSRSGDSKHTGKK